MKKLDQAGLTVTELMISVGIAGILASSLLFVSLGFFGDTVRGQATSTMIVQSHFALRTLTEDLRLSSKIIPTNTITDANAPIGGWVTSDAANVLVIATPAVTANNQIIYNETTGDPYLNELVYFLSNGVLHKRLLKNSAAPGNRLVTTCPEALATATCPADLQYAGHIRGLDLGFYDFNNTATTDPLLTRAVRVNLDLSRRVFGQEVSFNSSTFVRMRN